MKRISDASLLKNLTLFENLNLKLCDLVFKWAVKSAVLYACWNHQARLANSKCLLIKENLTKLDWIYPNIFNKSQFLTWQMSHFIINLCVNICIHYHYKIRYQIWQDKRVLKNHSSRSENVIGRSPTSEEIVEDLQKLVLYNASSELKQCCGSVCADCKTLQLEQRTYVTHPAPHRPSKQENFPSLQPNE